MEILTPLAAASASGHERNQVLGTTHHLICPYLLVTPRSVVAVNGCAANLHTMCILGEKLIIASACRETSSPLNGACTSLLPKLHQWGCSLHTALHTLVNFTLKS